MKNKPNKKEIDGFIKICNEIIALKKKKAGDYANSWRVLGIQGVYNQIGRKFTRLWLNKDKSENELNYEMMLDTLTDLAVYSIMAIQLLNSGETEDQILKILKQ
jgi:hypothetical protein